ncbi:MAG: CpXC domain-containing protein [Peptococcaceae bacterium]|nr:CpXC domain-containing protein [Peptococcaceae bacterium]
MTVKHTQAVACLKCGKESPFDFYASINTLQDPKLKQRVKNFDLFKFICPHCGSEQFVGYSFLYHQMEDRWMIFCCQEAEEVAEVRTLFDKDDFSTVTDSHGVKQTIDTAAYQRRIVVGVDDLVEKIRMIDAGLDDRLMEVYKVMLYGQMQPQLEAMPGGDAVDVLYLDENLQGALNIVFMADGQAVGEVPFAREAYESIQNSYEKAVKRLADGEVVIDQDWAFEFLAKVAQGA